MPINKELLRKIIWVIIAGLALLTLILWGISENNEVTAAIIKLYLVLFAMIALAYWLMRFLKKTPQNKSSSRFQITERLSLENGAGLYLVESDKRAWLIGVGNKQLSVIDRWPVKDLVDEL